MLSESGGTGGCSVSTLGETLAGIGSITTPSDLRTLLDQAGRLAHLAARTTLPGDGDLEIWIPALAVPPPRWNFAGYCSYCTSHGCRSRHCAAEWSRAAWAICNVCRGRGHDTASASPCACVGGLMEVTID